MADWVEVPEPKTYRDVLYVTAMIDQERGIYRAVKLVRTVPRATLLVPGVHLPEWQVEATIDTHSHDVPSILAEIAEGQLIDMSRLDPEGDGA